MIAGAKKLRGTNARVCNGLARLIGRGFIQLGVTTTMAAGPPGE